MCGATQLIFLNISSKVLTLSLIDPYIFTLQANIPTTALLTVQSVKNKLCFILCQDKAFEDKMDCQFQRVS